MRTIIPITKRIIILAAITFLFNSCSDQNNHAGGNTVNSVEQTDNITDGKPIIEFDSTNYGTVTFKNAATYYEINVSGGVPYFVVIESDSRADIEITDSNEFLNYNDRAYAIIVDNGLILSEMQ